MRRACLLLLVVSAVVLTMACEEGGGNLAFVNETRTTVLVYPLGDHSARSIAPGERITIGTLISDWPNKLVATNDQGGEIFSKRYTWDEIDSVGLTILFSCESPAPTPTRAELVTVQC